VKCLVYLPLCFCLTGCFIFGSDKKDAKKNITTTAEAIGSAEVSVAGARSNVQAAMNHTDETGKGLLDKADDQLEDAQEDLGDAKKANAKANKNLDGLQDKPFFSLWTKLQIALGLGVAGYAALIFAKRHPTGKMAGWIIKAKGWTHRRNRNGDS